MKRIKIICTVTNDLTYDQRMIRICTSLSNAGYEVILVGRKRAFSKPFQAQVFQQKRLQCFFNKGKLFYLEYNFRLFWWLLFSKLDIVCAIDLDTILAGFWISKLRHKVCVYDAHEYFTEVPEVIERPKVKWAWEWVAKSTIPQLNYCYTVCESLSKIFDDQYNTAFEVIRNVPFSLDLSTKTFNPPNSKTILLYQGVLNDGRGLEEIIEAMPFLDNTVLWLAGEGDLSQLLRVLVVEKRLEKKVKFLGYLTPDELKKVTAQATIGLNLLKNKGLNYYYSLANKAFDYIQHEVPSLNMNFPEYQHINKQFEVFKLVEDLKVNTLVNAIKILKEDPKVYRKLQTNCRLARTVFNWEKEEKKLLAFYEKVCKTEGLTSKN